MAFLPLCAIPLRGGEVADIRTVYMARPDRVWRLPNEGSGVVASAFRSTLQAYLTRYFGRAADRWINPATLYLARYGRGYMTLGHGVFVERKDREITTAEFYDLVKFARLEFVGRHTYVALPLAYLWSEGSRTLYLPGTHARVACGLVPGITAKVKAMGWPHIGTSWMNPAKTCFVTKGQIRFDYEMYVSFGGLDQKGLVKLLPGQWEEVESDSHVNLRTIRGFRPGKNGATRLRLGDELVVEVSGERARIVRERCQALGLSSPPRFGG